TGPALRGTAHPPPARAAQNEALRRQVIQLGQVTGDETFKAQVVDVLKDIDQAKKLVPVAVQMAQAKDPNLTYYGALTLAQVAEKDKDYKAVETLYSVGMDKAVKLYSTRKILQSYGGLVDALFKGKKYAEAARVCREVLEIKTGDETPRKFFFIQEDKFGDFGFLEAPNYDVAKPIQSAFYQMMIQSMAKEGKYEQ